MLETFKQKAENIADNYADLVCKNIEAKMTADVVTVEDMISIHEDIRFLNHVSSVLERIDRIQRENAHGTKVD